MNYKVEAYGAIGDGQTVCTEQIQAAIDACSEVGGGKVILGQGTYITGTLEIKSGVEFHIKEGVILKGSRNLEDYPDIPDLFVDGCNDALSPEKKGYALLYTYNSKQIILSGQGIVDLDGPFFAELPKRPFILRVIESSHIAIKTLHFLNSGAWCCHLSKSNHIHIDGLNITSYGISNGDGIDVDSCSEVTIENADIKTSDDAICFKTTSYKPCEHIVIKNCKLMSHCAGIKFGTESLGDFKDIHISGCKIMDCGVSAIKMTPVDGGSVTDVTFEDCKIIDSTGPIFMAVGRRQRTYYGQPEPTAHSRISNVNFKGIDATSKRYVRNRLGVILDDLGQGVVISGRPDSLIESVTFDDCNFAFYGGIRSYKADEHKVPFLEDQYPECYALGLLPAFGYYVQYTKCLTMNHCINSQMNPDCRPLKVILE